MKVISTNLAKPTTIIWNGKEEKTGLFKHPTKEPLFLGIKDVHKDTVVDRKHHGGINKACYLFSADYYMYWKSIYPDLKWDWGMFGENLTIEGLNESKLRIGDIYKLGTASIQISEPREPCYKLGVRFGNQAILKQFIKHEHPGTYIKILKEGTVKIGDEFELIEQSNNVLTVQQFYRFLFAKQKNIEVIKLALTNDCLPDYKKEQLKKYL